jgi:glyoxylase-like metal-dependent hydrolase (beta-lactamase superfamily II)
MTRSPKFISDETVDYGTVLPVSPLIRRVVARNPGPFTYTGSGTYIVGRGDVAVIDPGPDLPDHVQALVSALRGERVSVILVTHTHRDHSPAARPLAAATGAPIWGCAPIQPQNDDGPRVEEAFDSEHSPSRILTDGDAVSGPGWTLRTVATPGHASNHLCFALEEEHALFTGDHVMGWATTVVAPPDGNMAAYIASLRKLLDRNDRIYYPTHGKPVTRPKSFVRALIAHRRQRERQILNALANGSVTIPAIVAQLYASVAPALHGAAGQSVLAHLNDLSARGKVGSNAESNSRARIYHLR